MSGGGQATNQAAWKRAVAEAAVHEIADGATIGLGTGSTSEQMIYALAERVRQGLRVRAVASSERTQALASSLGIPMVALDEVDQIDISIDGADEVTLPDLDLIKGRGGALLREKIMALSSRYRIILVDITKLVPELGAGTTIPVEVEMYGWRHTAERLATPGCRVIRRPLKPGATGDGPDAEPFITDGGHYTLDLIFDSPPEIPALAARLKATVGVVEHGLFLGMTDRVYIGGYDGVRHVDRPR